MDAEGRGAESAKSLDARLLAIAIALSAVGGVVLLGVGIHELEYARDHPGAYGPAKVIAWAAFAAAAVAASVAVLAFALLSRRSA